MPPNIATTINDLTSTTTSGKGGAGAAAEVKMMRSANSNGAVTVWKIPKLTPRE